VSKVKNLHRKWMKDPTREHTKSWPLNSNLPERAYSGASQCRPHARGIGQTHEDNPVGYRTARKWSHKTVHSDIGASGGV
jgi:hypothetical protein